MRAAAALLLALCGIAACSAGNVDEGEFGSTQTLTDGLKIKKMFVPPGCSHKRRSKSGDQMSMQYTGSLTSGKIFDSSRNPGVVSPDTAPGWRAASEPLALALPLPELRKAPTPAHWPRRAADTEL